MESFTNCILIYCLKRIHFADRTFNMRIALAVMDWVSKKQYFPSLTGLPYANVSYFNVKFMLFSFIYWHEYVIEEWKCQQRSDISEYVTGCASANPQKGPQKSPSKNLHVQGGCLDHLFPVELLSESCHLCSCIEKKERESKRAHERVEKTTSS